MVLKEIKVQNLVALPFSVACPDALDSRENYLQVVNAVLIRTGGNTGYLLCVYSFQAVLFYPFVFNMKKLRNTESRLFLKINVRRLREIG